MARKSVARRKRSVSSKKKQKKVRTMEFADIPACLDPAYAQHEYKTSLETKIWDPEVDVEGWYPGFNLVSRAILTRKQQQKGIPITEAMETSCSGVGEQYILDVLHESKYEPHDAMRMMTVKDIPQQFINKWNPEEMKLFTEGVMKHGKNFSIIRRKMLPHKQVTDFADFYYVWKRSSMAESWRKARAIIKAEEKKRLEKRSKNRTNKSPDKLTNNEHVRDLPNNEPPPNVLNNELLRDLSNDRIMTRRATAHAILSLKNGKGTDDDSKSSTSTSPSEKYEGSSSAAGSTDSSVEDVHKHDNELPETATSVKSPMKNEQISDNSMQRRHKRKLSIPRKIVRYEIECVPTPIIPQWKRQRRCELVV